MQLKQELEDNAGLTVSKFMTIMERDFGKDFSSQARDELRQIRIGNCGKSLTAKEWRTFRMQWEAAARRVEDKGEREEYEMLYSQLSNYWQEKVVKEERKSKGNRCWVKMSTPEKTGVCGLTAERRAKVHHLQRTGIRIHCAM